MGLKVSIEGKEGTSIIVWINNERYFYNDFDFGLLSKLKKLLKPKPREAIEFLEDHSISYTRPDGQVINLKGSIMKTIKIKKKQISFICGKKLDIQSYYDAVSSGIFREGVSNSIQNDGQKLLDALKTKDIKVIDKLMLKYQRDAGRDQGGRGAGPKKVKQARSGAAQLWKLAVKAKSDLK